MPIISVNKNHRNIPSNREHHYTLFILVRFIFSDIANAAVVVVVAVAAELPQTPEDDLRCARVARGRRTS